MAMAGRAPHCFHRSNAWNNLMNLLMLWLIQVLDWSVPSTIETIRVNIKRTLMTRIWSASMRYRLQGSCFAGEGVC